MDTSLLIMGLADINPESVPSGDALRQLDGDLVAYFGSNDCRTIEDAEVDVRRMLDSRGLQDWHIASSSAAPNRPCASFGLDTLDQTVHLIAIPRPG